MDFMGNILKLPGCSQQSGIEDPTTARTTKEIRIEFLFTYFLLIDL